MCALALTVFYKSTRPLPESQFLVYILYAEPRFFYDNAPGPSMLTLKHLMLQLDTEIFCHDLHAFFYFIFHTAA